MVHLPFNNSLQLWIYTAISRKKSLKHFEILLNKISILECQISTFCAPKIKGHYGLPAGLAIDKDNSMLVTDLRLGILRIQPNGTYNLVRTCSITLFRILLGMILNANVHTSLLYLDILKG